MNKDIQILDCLASIKNICERQKGGNDYPICDDCPFFSCRSGTCLILEDNPCDWDLNDDSAIIWRALL